MAEMIDMNEERAERCRRRLIATVAAAGEYLQKNAETLIDQTMLHGDVDIFINIPNGTMVPAIRVTQEHIMKEVAELWMKREE